ncbi:nucleotide modification associated domain-containing protein [Anaerococcus sp. DFU013_CI05]|uniref:nucleotide modification associated domain-containing protein n=1 Tax=Anaerococcus sp. AH8042_DFU013_CI05 TaxID=3385202 RepID=UPI003A52391E
MNKADRMAVIFREMLETYKAKNADYGDSFSKSYQEFGLTAPVVRISDKVERLKALTRADARVKDESIKDTFIDCANYCVMAVVEMELEDSGFTITPLTDYEKWRLGICPERKKPIHVGDKGFPGEPAPVKDYDQGDKLNI